MQIDNISKKLTRAMQAPKEKTSAFDTRGVVTRIEEDTAWVRLTGSSIETPVRLTIAASKGDVVQVRVSGGSAWLTGNGSAPPTDDTTANESYKVATKAGIDAAVARDDAAKAYNYASQAEAEAARAKTAADVADAKAIAAGQAASAADAKAVAAGQSAAAADAKAVAAGQSAAAAQKSADAANTYANDALTGLNVVEDVIGTLNWISDHGYYQLSTDTEVAENRVYYTATGTAIQNPSGNPSYKRYYERSGDGTEQDPYIYTKSNDTEVATGKTYYTLAVTTVAEPTGSPADNLYYILVINDSVHNYISTHLALTESGLDIFGTNTMGRLRLTTNGVEIYPAGSSNVIAQYGSATRLGNALDRHITIDSTNGFVFWAGDESNEANMVAWFTDNQLHIPNAVVTDNLITGRWKWDASTNPNRLDLKYIGPEV